MRLYQMRDKIIYGTVRQYHIWFIILIRSKNFHLTSLRVSVILAIKFKQVHAVNERKSEVRSLREPVDGENRCDVSVIYHS